MEETPHAVETDGYERYGSFQIDGEETVIFDRLNEAAWVRSSETRPVRE
ncbi:MAG: hypothetical protein ABEJ28_04660 [Salinigranum sp.]